MTTRFADSFACDETDLVSTVADTQKTGWSGAKTTCYGKRCALWQRQVYSRFLQ